MIPRTISSLSWSTSSAARSSFHKQIFIRSLSSTAAKLQDDGSKTESLRRTGLYDFHVANQAKMVPFAGYSMPLSYGDVGTGESHRQVRQGAGLFDVGHMVQHIFRGTSALSFLQHLTPSSLTSLGPGQSTLSVMLNDEGGIIDDLVITRHNRDWIGREEEGEKDVFYVVTNAGRRHEDLSWILERLGEWEGGEVEHEVLEGWGLVALQGPQSASHLQQFTLHDLSKLTFGTSAFINIPRVGRDVKVHVARGGYTGEDGFEISVLPRHTVALAALLTDSGSSLSSQVIQLAGLGARDTLRIEAGMCLYGHDIDESVSPVEAGLGWVVGKDRREKADFIGAKKVLEHFKKGGCPTKRVGLVVHGAPAREGAKIFAPSSSSAIGRITSGIPSPTLGKNIAMGYISTQSGLNKTGSKVSVEVRGKMREAEVVKMPFVETKYYRG